MGFAFLKNIKNVIKNESNSAAIDDYVICAPIKGEIISLKEVQDIAFSNELLGKGIAIEPINGVVVSPVDGHITALFPSMHAIGVTSENGIEILIHIGINTVNLNGKYFKVYVKENQYVKKGDKLVEFDIDSIKKAGYEVITPVIITNYAQFKNIIYTKKRIVNIEDMILELVN